MVYTYILQWFTPWCSNLFTYILSQPLTVVTELILIVQQLHFIVNLEWYTFVQVFYKWYATATAFIWLYFFVLSLFNKYKKNCVKNMKCSCDKWEPVNLIHCKYELTCSQISMLIPSKPSTLLDLKFIPHLWPMAWNRSCQNLVNLKSSGALLSAYSEREHAKS